MPAEAVERVVRHALFRYLDPDRGTLRTAYRGDRIRVAGEDLERGERFEALVEDESDLVEPSATDDGGEDDDPDGPETSPPGAQDDDVDGEDEDLDVDSPERPPLAANKDAWTDFRIAESNGALTKEQLDQLTKPELQDDARVAQLTS